MKFSIILIIGIAVLAAINLATAQPDISHDILDNEHYIVVGHIYEPYTQDNEVILINTKTGENLKVTAIDCEVGIFQPPMKEYLFDLANLHQGWTHNDTFILTYENTAAQFNITNESIAYQQDIQRPDDVDPIFILSGFLILAVGGGYFYMRKKKDSKEVTTLEEKPQEPQPEKRCLIDIVFGGTKKAWIIIMTLGLFGAYAAGIEIPKELIILYSSIIGIYFGAGGVKLGMNLKK